MKTIDMDTLENGIRLVLGDILDANEIYADKDRGDWWDGDDCCIAACNKFLKYVAPHFLEVEIDHLEPR